MTKKPLAIFYVLGLLLVALFVLVYLVNQWTFNHRYSVMVNYQGQDVQTLEINFYSGDEVVNTERFANQKGDDPSVRQWLQFRTRADIDSLSAVLIDKNGQALKKGVLNEVLVKTKWSQVQQFSVVTNPHKVDVTSTHVTARALLKRNTPKILFVFLATFGVLFLLTRYQSLNPHRWSLLFLFALVVLMTLMSGEVISDRTIYGDGVGQLRAAYNLYAHTIFAEQLGSPPVPDNFIEPFPAFVNSIYFRLLEWRLHTPLDFARMHWGDLVYLVKQIHLVWVFVGQMALALFLFALTRKLWLATLAVLLAQVFFFGNYQVLDTYYTELQGGVLLLLASMALYFTVLKARIAPGLISGALLALLALTKASFYYINLLVLLVLGLILLYSAWSQRKFTFKQALLVWLAVLVAYAAVLGPWIARNYVLFNSPAISDRGGIVLYIRATKNQMTAEEVRGALYLYGPRLYHSLGEWWPYARPLANELDPNEGAWMRVNRNRSPHSFFAQVRNELNAATSVPDATGRTKTMNEVAHDMNQRAIQSILSQPLKHVGMSFVFLWRGMWGLEPLNIYLIPNEFDNLLGEMGMLFIYCFAIFGYLLIIFRMEMAFLSLGMLTFGGIAFYAGLSHFLPRYMHIFLPTLILLSSIFISKKKLND
jgi:hypothetical protein